MLIFSTKSLNEQLNLLSWAEREIREHDVEVDRKIKVKQKKKSKKKYIQQRAVDHVGLTTD